MKKEASLLTRDGYTLRLSEIEDTEAYYQQGFAQQDAEVARLTGSKSEYAHDEVVDYFLKCIEASDRYDFLIFAPDGRIIGESVINEIDWDLRKANFRICMFHSDFCGKGIGSWAIRVTRDFAFENLGLHRLELSVFSFNTRAERAYLSAGFKREGVLRDAVRDGEQYADDILMAILEDEWKEIR